MGNEIYALRQYLPLVRLGKVLDIQKGGLVSASFVSVSRLFFCLCFSSWLQGSGENSEAKSPLESGCTPLFIMGSVGFQLSAKGMCLKKGRNRA